MKLFTTIAAGVFMASAVSASAELLRHDTTGLPYLASENENGIVMRSDKGTLYLGKNCDAFHTVYGAGTWDWANGGFRAVLGNRIIGFPRSDVPGQEFYAPCHSM